MALRHSFAILALLGSSASWATTTTPALVVCDPCKLTEMSNHAISQGPGIRYMMNLTSNTVKKFEVKYGSGIPNVVSEDIRTSSNEALSVASQTLIAVEQTVEVDRAVAGEGVGGEPEADDGADVGVGEPCISRREWLQDAVHVDRVVPAAVDVGDLAPGVVGDAGGGSRALEEAAAPADGRGDPAGPAGSAVAEHNASTP